MLRRLHGALQVVGGQERDLGALNCCLYGLNDRPLRELLVRLVPLHDYVGALSEFSSDTVELGKERI